MKRSELFFTFILIPIDVLMILLAFILAYKFRLNFEVVPTVYFQPFGEYVRFIVLWIPLLIAVFALTGLYSKSERKTIPQEFSKIIVAVSASIALIMVWFFLQRIEFFSRLVIAYGWILAIVLVFTGRLIVRFLQQNLYRFGVGVHRVIVLGGNGSTKTITNEIKNNWRLGYKLVKIIDHDGITKLDRIVANNPCDEIILADSSLSEKEAYKILEFCQLNRLSFKMTPNLFLVQTSHVDVQQLAEVPILEFKRTPLDGWGRIIKRVVDIIFSFIFMIITSPLLLIIAFLIKLTSKGPILFRQERVGLEHNFTFLKFRSMKFEYCTGRNYGGKYAEEFREILKKKGNEVDGPVFKIKNDPRITPMGKFLRKTSLDELPQFFNVLKGEMSLIGPRPPLPEEVKKYNNFQKKRLGVKPGITGLWQVSGRSELSFDEWVKLDSYYIENWSLWLDFQIFFKTILVVFKGRGAY